MPIPNPRKRETKRKFISRCMKKSKKEYPKRTQRLAICFNSFRKARGKRFYGYGFTQTKTGKRFYVGPFKTKKLALEKLEKAKKRKKWENIRLVKESLFFFKTKKCNKKNDRFK